MTLKDFLTHRRRLLGMKYSARQFAQQLGITESYLSKLASGKQLPSLRLLKKMIKESDGLIQLENFE